MKIGLVSYSFINKDIAYNLSQVEKAMKQAQGKADLLCFGETFLQGFDALEWNYEQDRQVGIALDSSIMSNICSLSRQYEIDLLMGYIEREKHSLYSSAVLIEKGRILHNYRRISKGWKEYTITDEHYQEGTQTDALIYQGKEFKIALCGDMWEFSERFQTEGILLWPVYVNFSLADWQIQEQVYAKQALLASKHALMINSLSENPVSHGGAFYFHNGNIEKRLPYDKEDILIVEI